MSNLDHAAHLVHDHEGNELTVTINGDAPRYGAFVEIRAAESDLAATAHLTGAAMRELAAFLAAKAGPA